MQELTTYFDNTRYENLNSLVDKGDNKPDSLSAKPAKLSAFARLKAKTDSIKSSLASQNKAVAEAPAVEPSVEMPAEVSAEPTPEVNAETPTVPETPKIEFPSKEVLETKMEEKEVTIYNTFGDSTVTSAARKLRVAPQVKESTKYAKDTIGVEYTIESPELSNVDVEPEMAETEEPVQMTETPQEEGTFDFSALPGVDVGVEEPSYENEEYDTQDDYSNEQEGTPYEEDYRTEQDDRLNDYLNRENYNDNIDYSNNFDELEEIRKLKREIEEARESLMQVKQNVGDLQQKDNVISEQLAAYKRSLMEEKDAVNAELVDQTREWNDLTQLVRQKEELIGDEESYGMGRAA